MYLTKDHKEIVNKFKGEERKQALGLLEKYFKDYSIESVSDINTLKEIIFYEIIQYRLQDKLNDFAESKTIPIQLVNVMHENSEAIIKLKNSLGLFADKEKKSEYDVLKHLKRRFKVWLEENQASRTLVCPHCSKMILLKMKTDIWESQKHPYFKDRVIYNKVLFKLYNDQKISKKELAAVLETSEDYIDWVINKIEKVEQYNLPGGPNASTSTGDTVSAPGPSFPESVDAIPYKDVSVTDDKGSPTTQA